MNESDIIFCFLLTGGVLIYHFLLLGRIFKVLDANYSIVYTLSSDVAHLKAVQNKKEPAFSILVNTDEDFENLFNKMVRNCDVFGYGFYHFFGSDNLIIYKDIRTFEEKTMSIVEFRKFAQDKSFFKVL